MKIHFQSGITMLETLISLFVLSLGVIGSAAMFLTAWKTTQHSGFQTSAVEWASELADNIRIHSISGSTTAVKLFMEIDYRVDRDGEPVKPAKSCYGLAANCTREELAKYEIYELKKKLKMSLPTARVRVCNDASSWSEWSKSYQWECDDLAEGIAPTTIKLGWSPRTADYARKVADGPVQPTVVLIVPKLSA